MAFVDNLEFLNLNSFRAFPIKEGLTRLSQDGLFTIPDDFLVDLVVSISSNVARSCYISRITNFFDKIVIDLSDENNTFVGNFIIFPATHVQYQMYVLNPGESYAGANGKLVVNTLATMQALPSGTFYFTKATAEFEARTIVPSVSGINRVLFTDVEGNQHSFTGDLKIEARLNLNFTYDSLNNKITIDAGDGLGLNTDCGAASNPITTINGVSPDVNGNFLLDFASCATLTVLTSNDGLLLNDVCCKPCIGCEEIGTLTDRTISLETDLLTLRTYYSNLLSTFNEFKTTVTYTCDC